MQSKHRANTARFFWLHRVVTLSSLVIVLLFALSAAGWADAIYVLTGVENSAIVLRVDDTAAASTLAASQRLYLSEYNNSRDVALTSGQRVTIHRGGETIQAVCRQERVSSLLDRLRVEVAPEEMVSIDLSSSDEVVITIAKEISYLEEETLPAPYATVRRPNEQLPLGKERVVQQGQDGERTCAYNVVWSGGELVSRTLLSEISNTSVEEIVEYGTGTPEPVETLIPTPSPTPSPTPTPTPTPEVETMVLTASASAAEEPVSEPDEPAVPANNSSLPMDELVEVKKNGDGGGTLIFKSGRVARFKAIRNMTATAYNKDEPKVGTITATGTTVHKGVIAVDRRVISLGTKMYVVAKGYEYGYGVAEDTGVTGNVIDLYFESYRGMVNFGRRSCTVYILE